MLKPPRQPKILLAEAEDGPGHCVSICPPPAGRAHDYCFRSYGSDREYAAPLEREFAWLVIDRVDREVERQCEADPHG